MKALEIFMEDCNKGYCNRYGNKTKQCSKEEKQLKCYTKYCNKRDKDLTKLIEKSQRDFDKSFEIDERWAAVCEEVDIRDRVCVIWNKVFTSLERKYISDNFYVDFKLLSEMDHCHIISRGANRSLKYDSDNIFLARRFFHQRFDSYRDLVTGESLTKEEREKRWVGRIKNVILNSQ